MLSKVKSWLIGDRVICKWMNESTAFTDDQVNFEMEQTLIFSFWPSSTEN